MHTRQAMGRRRPHAKFLIQATYTPEGAKGLLEEGASGRRAAVEQVVTELGGQVEAMYFAFGEDDIVLIVDFPDPVAMAAVSLTVKAGGGLHTRATPTRSMRPPDGRSPFAPLAGESWVRTLRPMRGPVGPSDGGRFTDLLLRLSRCCGSRSLISAGGRARAPRGWAA
ncbi:GYD domain-containing protein [Streptomyces sp. NPDC051098]|uniref:GYD domain-containing protein n=1 Tax=Streptomyces sp. NPDC051098 TaxID=3155411 RepID=UPI0034386585